MVWAFDTLARYLCRVSHPGDSADPDRHHRQANAHAIQFFNMLFGACPIEPSPSARPTSPGQENVRIAVEGDLHGDALHDLYIISRRIFGWQEAENSPAARLDAVDMTGKTAAISVDVNIDRLARTKARQFRLFEIRGHPNVERQKIITPDPARRVDLARRSAG